MQLIRCTSLDAQLFKFLCGSVCGFYSGITPFKLPRSFDYGQCAGIALGDYPRSVSPVNLHSCMFDCSKYLHDFSAFCFDNHKPTFYVLLQNVIDKFILTECEVVRVYPVVLLL